MQEFRYRPLPTAEKVHADERELIALVGPWGSGKSTVSAIELYQHCLNYNCDGLVVRDTYPALRDSCVTKWLEIFGSAGEMLQGIANKNVTEAVAVLHSSKWWVQTIKMAMDNPKTVNTLLLNKLLDKAHPTPQSIRVGGDEGFKLIIEHVGKE